MEEFIPVEVFPPGEFVRDELDARGWTQRDLAEIMGCSHRLVNEIVKARRSVTPETARALGAALGTSAELWLNLESSYRLHLSKSDDAMVRRRARVYELAPVSELKRRGWIRDTSRIDELEREICRFFGIEKVEDEPQLWKHAARKSASYESVTPAQRAWLFRVRQLAGRIDAAEFTEEAFRRGLDALRPLLADARLVSEVSRVLARAGVRFLAVEHLSGTRIDGACLWLGPTAPVVALSLRYDRIDWFWHTLMHELGHVQYRDGLDRPLPPDTNLVGDESTPERDKPGIERRADRFAAGFLIRQRELTRFAAGVAPYFSKEKIRQFAERLGVHPGIVVGQLQHRGKIPYRYHRKMLVKVRERVISSALTDGWGSAPGPVE